jgi:hypothetical protein
MRSISHRELLQLPVRQKGCVKDALGVKYVSTVSRWIEGGDCVRRCIMPGISLTVAWVVSVWSWGLGKARRTWMFHFDGCRNSMRSRSSIQDGGFMRDAKDQHMGGAAGRLKFVCVHM